MESIEDYEFAGWIRALLFPECTIKQVMAAIERARKPYAVTLDVTMSISNIISTGTSCYPTVEVLTT